jgi:hypothetical protein
MPVPAPGRSCGSCTECCKTCTVDELQKPGGVYCSHCTIGGGCQIYPDRPASCRTFMCSWLYTPQLGPEFKPDKTHVVIWEWTVSRILFADCDPDRPDAWRSPKMINLLRETAMRNGPSGWKVVAAVKKQVWRITEDFILSEEGDLTWFVGHRSFPDWRVAGPSIAQRRPAER